MAERGSVENLLTDMRALPAAERENGGMSEDERRELSLRLRALMHRRTAAHLELAATMTRTTAAFRAVTEVLKRTPVEYVTEHPDLAELDLMLDGFYND